MDISTIDAALTGSGLTRLGAFHPGADDGVPETDANQATLVLLGNAGPDMAQVHKTLGGLGGEMLTNLRPQQQRPAARKMNPTRLMPGPAGHWTACRKS